MSCVAATASIQSAAAGAASRGFYAIPQRNVFRLISPAKEAAPIELPSVDLVGIITFGQRRAVLKVQSPGEQEEFLILAEDQAANGIQLLAIDVEARRVRIDIRGRREELGFSKFLKKRPPS